MCECTMCVCACVSVQCVCVCVHVVANGGDIWEKGKILQSGNISPGSKSSIDTKPGGKSVSL
jgi:hypothetical protein